MFNLVLYGLVLFYRNRTRLLPSAMSHIRNCLYLKMQSQPSSQMLQLQWFDYVKLKNLVPFMFNSSFNSFIFISNYHKIFSKFPLLIKLGTIWKFVSVSALSSHSARPHCPGRYLLSYTNLPSMDLLAMVVDSWWTLSHIIFIHRRENTIRFWLP